MVLYLFSLVCINFTNPRENSLSDSVGKLLDYTNLWVKRFIGDQTTKAIYEGQREEQMAQK